MKNAYRLNAASSAEYTRQRYVILSDRRKSQIFGGSRRIFAPIWLFMFHKCEDSSTPLTLRSEWQTYGIVRFTDLLIQADKHFWEY